VNLVTPDIDCGWRTATRQCMLSSSGRRASVSKVLYISVGIALYLTVPQEHDGQPQGPQLP